jgi:hypothetical protein
MATMPEAVQPARLVLLGASNLTGATATVLDTARGLFGGPFDILAALGNGRSYGLHHVWMGRGLPGILHCGLWDALEQCPPAPALALLADIGNDLLYEVPPDEVAGWVEECAARLQRAGARVLLTALPLCNVRTFSPAKFTLMRRMCFPRCGLDFAALLGRATDLDSRLRDLARRRGLVVVEHRPEWYGMDPFHIRRRFWPGAWHSILSGSAEALPPAAGRVSLGRRLYLRLLVPERRWLFGWEQRRAQPAGRLPDGTTVSLY